MIRTKCPLTKILRNTCPRGMSARRAPSTCPEHYLCIKHAISSSKFVLTLGKHPSRPHYTANLLCKAPCTSRNMKFQRHKMSLSPLATTTLAIVINRVQKMGPNIRHGEKILQLVW